MSRDETARIKEFWEDRASDSNLSGDRVTHPDLNQRLLEIEVVLQHLPSGQRILDVGCGNGFSTNIFSRYADHIVGLDYSASMIERAKNEYKDLQNADFMVGDVLDLRLPENSFDAAISQRCLINLPTWKEQQQAIINIAKILKPNGFFFFQEGSSQGREKLNQARELFDLKRMPPVAYNLDFNEDLLWPFIRKYFKIVEIRRFGLYDLIARIVHPLVVRPSEPEYDARINEVARQLSAQIDDMGEFSREFSAVLRKLE